MKKIYIIFFIIFSMCLISFIFINKNIKIKKEELLKSETEQFEVIKKIISDRFKNFNEYNIILDKSMYYNFVTGIEYSNVIKEKLDNLEKKYVGSHLTYIISIKYNNLNNCLTITNEIKELNEKHVQKYYLNVENDIIKYTKNNFSYSEYT
ncbi:MAG: hypothetical protein J6A15_07860 [Clostridia bacterium]|nr:hypothetical protein [Clostridia bacterium]